MAIDPYSTPSTDVLPPPYAAAGAVTDGILRQLAGTKPWVRLVSVMMFIGSGLMLIGAAFVALAGATIFSNPRFGAYQAGMGVGIAVAYALFAILYLYPAVKLWKYATRIGTLLSSGQAMDLESALNEQRAFWKFIGVIILVVLCLYGLIAVIGIIAAVVAQAHH